MFRFVSVLVASVLVALSPRAFGFVLALVIVGLLLLGGFSLAFSPMSGGTDEPLDPLDPRDVLGDEWKPCRNPQCLSPISAKSRKSYCSPECAAVVRRMRLRDEAESYDPADGTIPF